MMKKFTYLFSILLATSTAFAHAKVEPSPAYISIIEAYQKNQQPIAIQDNGFIFEQGLLAPKDNTIADIEDQLRIWVEDVKINPEAKSPFANGFWQLNENYRSLNRIFDVCAAAESTGCPLAHYEGLAYGVLSRSDWLMARYDKLLTYPQYQSVFNAKNFGFALYDNLKVQHFYLVNIWLNRYEMPVEEIQKKFQADFDFQIKRLTNANHLLEKLFAAKGLGNHYFWLNETLKSIDQKVASQLVENLLDKKLPAQALNLQRAFVGDFNLLYLLEPEQLKVQPSEDQKQQLANDYALFTQAFLEMAESKDLHKALAEKMQNPALQRATDSMRDILIAIYQESDREYIEQFTKLEVILSQSIYYIQRIRDLSDLPQAVKLLAQIRQENLSAEQIPVFLSQVESLNPVTQKQYEWDSKTNTIYSQGMDGYLRLYDDFDLDVVFQEHMPDNFYKSEESLLEKRQSQSCSPN